MGGDRRTPGAWLRAKGRVPTGNKLDQLGVFFKARLGDKLPGFSIRYLSMPLEEFKVEFKKLVHHEESAAETPISLPYSPPPMPAGHSNLLCGTYHLYRRSFVGDADRVIRDLIAVRPSGDQRFLNAELRCFPVGNTNLNQVPPETADVYKGMLHRYGQIFTTMLYYSNVETRDWRLRILQFPILNALSNNHYGLMTGFSSRLAEPVVGRALAMRISDKDVLEENCKAGRLRAFNSDDAAIAQIVPLIDNNIPNGRFVLSVDRKQVPDNLKSPEC